MNDEILADFLEQRLEGLAYSTQEDYLRGWSGMLQGLEQANISIPVGIDFFNTQVATYKEDALERGEVFNTPLQVVSPFTPMEVIEQLPFASSCLAQLQYETGFRVSEAYAVIENLESHLEDLKIKAVQGKGGQFYQEKIISLELKLMLLKLQREQMQLPNRVTYYRQLQLFNMRSHDLRAYYAKELYETTLAELKQQQPENSHVEALALAIVSEAINHHRPEITLYYLDKFGGAS